MNCITFISISLIREPPVSMQLKTVQKCSMGLLTRLIQIHCNLTKSYDPL